MIQRNSSGHVIVKLRQKLDCKNIIEKSGEQKVRDCQLSVIIPSYNRHHFLPKAIGSIVGQSLSCGEIIVVDDGSDDGTRETVGMIAASADMPIRYIRQNNSGVATARNRGIAEAKFPYVAFLDSDDYWLPKKLEKQFRLMVDHPDCQISYTGERWLRKGKHVNQKKKHLPGAGDIFPQCLTLCMVGMSTVMVKKELFALIGLFDETFPCCEDYELWLRVSARFRFLLVDEPLTIKQGGHQDQLSLHYAVGMDKFRIRALEKLLLQGELDERQRQLTVTELVRKLRIYGTGCLRHDRAGEGQDCLDRAKVLQNEQHERTL